MKFLKNNICSIMTMALVFSVVMIGDASAQAFGQNGSVFEVAGRKLLQLFNDSKMILFIIGGFGLIALAFQAIFGKVKWAWFAALAFGLAVIAAAGAVIKYASNTDGNTTQFNDSLK